MDLDGIKRPGFITRETFLTLWLPHWDTGHQERRGKDKAIRVCLRPTKSIRVCLETLNGVKGSVCPRGRGTVSPSPLPWL